MNDFNNFSDKVTFICSGGDFSSGSVIPKWLKNSGIKISSLTKNQLAAVIKAGKNGNDLDAARNLAKTFIKDGNNKPSKDSKSQEDLTTKLTDEQLQKFQYTLTGARTGTKSAAEKAKAYEEKLKAEKAKAEYDKFTSPGAVQNRNTQNSLENEALRKKLEIQSEGGRIRHAARGVLGSISDDSAKTYHINKYDSGNDESVIGYTLKNRKGLTNMGMDLISGFDPKRESKEVRAYRERSDKALEKVAKAKESKLEKLKERSDKALEKATKTKESELEKLKKKYDKADSKALSAVKTLDTSSERDVAKADKLSKKAIELEKEYKKAKKKGVQSDKADKLTTKATELQKEYKKVKKEDVQSDKADKLGAKANELQQSERVQAFGKSIKTAGDAGSLGLDFISSKHRDRTIREGGYEELDRKKAQIAYALGDRSLSTKIASGRGLLGKLHTSKIRSNRKRYARSLQYGLGFSENDLQNLSLILSKDFSDETDEVPELSWQPEEYAKLNAILTTDFETLDEQVALEKSQNNFSEEEEESDNPDLEVQTDNPTDDPKIDKGETELAVDYDNLDNDALVKILNTSFYRVNDEEKRYQESIAKGFSDEDRESDAYGEFLEGFSTFIDSSRTY